MINLLYCGNEKVFDGILSSIVSIISKTDKPICLYIFTMDLQAENPNYTPITEQQKDFLQKVLQNKNPQSKATLIDVTNLYLEHFKDNANKNTGYTQYTLIRLLADLLDMPNKLLYLDTDIMFKQDISKLYDIDITDYEFGASLDALGRFFIKYNYTNNGVLLLNMKKIKQTKLFEKARHMVCTKKMLLSDQSALNKHATKKLVLPRKFNEQYGIKADTVVKHFCKRFKWLPIPHLINIKQYDIFGMHKVLKCNDFDEELNQYIYLNNCYKNNLKEF